ncbi:hypothetical protein Slin15195_G006310 [Septoria linicola]|uniref:Uncharacterized protein n=1 Tax=Septoria linicola TaxID=215465 RepID=A0A9Q9EF64_9PEZI|nr:hypothetical protein Slin14017_G006330 [Septoria linicola]USW47312.1 hypothetical protein Slin15195_G006310 [Septoria linicola]
MPKIYLSGSKIRQSFTWSYLNSRAHQPDSLIEMGVRPDYKVPMLATQLDRADGNYAFGTL